MSSAERIEVDLGQARRAGRRRAGPAVRAAGRELRPDRSRPARPDGGAGTGPRSPGPDGVLDAARHWTEQAIAFTRAARPGPLPRRRVPGRPGAGVAAVGDGDDVAGGAGRARGPVLVLHHPARPVLAAAGAGGVAGGLQRDDAARHHRARGRARALLARPGAAARAHRRAADAALQRVRRGLGPLRRGTVRRGGLRRRRPAVRDRRVAGSAGPDHPAGLRDRRALGGHDRRRGRRAGSRPTRTWPGPPRCPRPAGPRSTRPTAGTPGASWRS